MSDSPYPAAWQAEWQWQGQPVSYVVCRSSDPDQAVDDSPAGGARDRPAVVLVHGFGACKEHWRHNLAALAIHHDVYAIDLLGFGSSGKPSSRLAEEPPEAGDCVYGIELWAQQVSAFIREVVRAPVTLVGNSIGGVVALRCASLLEQDGCPARQVLLVDCAQRALDDKRLADQPPLRRYGRPLLKSLVRQRWLTRWLFRQLSRAGVIRKVLEQAYPSGANIDDQLVAVLLGPTQQRGADEAFRGFINLFNDHLAPDLLATLSTPVRMVWGEADPWEPVAEARRWEQFACVKDLHVLPGLGHCPHDEAPEQVNPLLLQALSQEAA
ncbi:alpha/beta fold hydrolase [Synechococcus sp. CS-1328]|uniref:alpha/beta fold hydrolase n=1 Tax=Synechococcus sp. CS-1328 TaxID=2847976 RepID=UPI00223AFA79|nr:alpha/beta fold hydrolase [Synechococcus sp. CS-1328]